MIVMGILVSPNYVLFQCVHKEVSHGQGQEIKVELVVEMGESMQAGNLFPISLLYFSE